MQQAMQRGCLHRSLLWSKRACGRRPRRRYGTAREQPGCARPAALPDISGLQHAWQHPVGRLVVVEEGADVDDHLLAHLDAAFDGGRAHMR